MMTFLLFMPASKRGQDDVKQKIPEGNAQVDFVTHITQSYFDTLALLVISDIVDGTNVITGHKCNKGHKCNNICSQM